jgi:hypothetical protein
MTMRTITLVKTKDGPPIRQSDPDVGRGVVGPGTMQDFRSFEGSVPLLIPLHIHFLLIQTNTGKQAVSRHGGIIFKNTTRQQETMDYCMRSTALSDKANLT